MNFNNTIISLDVKTPPEIAKEVAQRVRKRRLELDFTQEKLADKAGLKLPTYRKFEQKGEISFLALLRIAWALDMLEEFDNLFSKRKYKTIEEAIEGNEPKRKRGKLK